MRERISCQKDTKMIYNYLSGFKKNVNNEEYNYPDDWAENRGQLNGVKLSTIFALAFSKGYANNKRKELSSLKDLSNPTNFENYLMPMINAIAIFNEGTDIMDEDPSEIYVNAEEYANEGIHILFDEYQDNMEDIIDEWHSDIDEIIAENQLLEQIENL